MRPSLLFPLFCTSVVALACNEQPPRDLQVEVDAAALSAQRKREQAKPRKVDRAPRASAKRAPYDGPRELNNRQFFPARGEGATVGSLRAPIVRTSRGFAALVPCKSKKILFKDEERSGADRLMTPGTRERLLRLADLVEAEWPGLQLRVTEAWDEENEHGRRSLHYEGRAVDLTVSDKDRRKLGRLAGLAAEAGFEWVYYESSHVHASTRRN